MTKKRSMSELDDWFVDQCDGDWEHGFGISISTFDNPGWGIDVQLDGTYLQDVSFEEIDKYVIENGDDYLQCAKVSDEGRIVFRGRCYAGRLNEMIDIFMNWAKDHKSNA